MRVAFAVLMTAVAALKIADEGTGGDDFDLDDLDWDDICDEIDCDEIDWSDLPSCFTDEEGNEICLSDLDLDGLDTADLGLAQ